MTDELPDPPGEPVEATDDEDDLDPVDEWLQFARNDLRSARTLLADDEIPPPIPCFHAQQAAEKALKAVLIATGVNPPKVHVSGKLYGQLPGGLKTAFDPDDLARLDPWAVAGRYPGDVPEIPRALAGDLVALADRVCSRSEEIIVGAWTPAARPADASTSGS
jgi:HEPN domain-containing protein